MIVVEPVNRRCFRPAVILIVGIIVHSETGCTLPSNGHNAMDFSKVGPITLFIIFFFKMVLAKIVVCGRNVWTVDQFSGLQ